MNRNRLTLVVAVGLLVLLIGTMIGASRWRNGPPESSQRTLVAELGYCGTNELRPCIDSFGQDADGYLQVNVLVRGLSYPDFFLTITRAGELNRYVCQKDIAQPRIRTCIGQNMPLGEILEFSLIAFTDDRVLANGQFAIIGLLLATPAVETTETPAVTEVVELEGTVPPVLLGFPTPLGPPTSTSYPNPSGSYPNPGPSYP